MACSLPLQLPCGSLPAQGTQPPGMPANRLPHSCCTCILPQAVIYPTFEPLVIHLLLTYVQPAPHVCSALVSSLSKPCPADTEARIVSGTHAHGPPGCMQHMAVHTLHSWLTNHPAPNGKAKVTVGPASCESGHYHVCASTCHTAHRQATARIGRAQRALTDFEGFMVPNKTDFAVCRLFFWSAPGLGGRCCSPAVLDSHLAPA